MGCGPEKESDPCIPLTLDLVFGDHPWNDTEICDACLGNEIRTSVDVP